MENVIALEIDRSTNDDLATEAPIGLNDEAKNLARDYAKRLLSIRDENGQFQIEQMQDLSIESNEYCKSLSKEEASLFRKLVIQEVEEGDRQLDQAETEKFVKDLEEKTPATSKSYKLSKKMEYAVADDESIIAKSRREYVFWFRAQQRKTARASLEMCRTVYEAMRSLSDSEFASFCQDIGYDDESSTIRKFSTIGKVYPRLIDYADQLPAAWTSIYLLTQIPADAFERCIREGFAFNQLSGSELKELVDKTRDANNLTSPFRKDKKEMAYPVAKVFFTKLPDDLDFRVLQKALGEVQARLPVRFQMIGEQVKLFRERSEQRYEQAKQEGETMSITPDKWDYGAAANEVFENPNAA